MRYVRSLIATSILGSTSLAAQSVRGTVVDAGGVPVSGVVVALLDDAGQTAGRALTNERGEYRVVAPGGGTYRLRTLRIGFRPIVSLAFALRPAEERTERLVVTGLTLTLAAVRVEERRSCRLDADSAAATFAVWEQVRGALTAAQLTAAAGGISATTVAYDRTLDRDFRRVREQTASVSTGYVREPWRTISPDVLHRAGYVVDDPSGVTTFFAPGLDMLASSRFIEDHCFRLARSRDTAQILIEFEPTAERKAVSDIAGTIWLDRPSMRLRRMEYRYANLDPQRKAHAGGEVEFVRFANGGWAIAAWSIRMPVLARLVSPNVTSGPRVAEIRVTGGELALALRGRDTLYARAPLVLTGTVVDSVSGAPVPAARMTLIGTALSAVADSLGRFAIGGVLPGNYALDVHTPSLDMLGIAHRQAIDVTGESAPLQVRVPGGGQIIDALCAGRAIRSPEPDGILLGSVYARGDSTPRGDVRVAAEWFETTARAGGGLDRRSRFVETRTAATGMFRLCGVARGAALVVHAVSDTAGAARVEYRLQGERIGRLTLVLDPARASSATFAGAVFADSTRQPIADASIELPELGRSTSTDERGTFRLSEVPVGGQRLIVRRIGYGPLDTHVTFAANRLTERTIYLSPVRVLDSVVVLEQRPSRNGFDERRRVGLGIFLDSTRLRRNEFHHVSDMLRTISGVRVVTPPPCQPSKMPCGHLTTRRVATNSRIPGYCAMQVVLNDAIIARGKRLALSDDDWADAYNLEDLAVGDLESVEIYRGGSEVPGRWGGTGALCGVLVLWMRGSR